MEKSNTETEKYREPPMDRFARLLWEQCDWFVSIGLGAAVVTLMWLVLHLGGVHTPLCAISPSPQTHHSSR
jgi:hypothetical protein